MRLELPFTDPIYELNGVEDPENSNAEPSTCLRGREMGYRFEMTAGENDPPPGEEIGDPEGDVLTAPAEPKLKKPQMYKVLILNDDYTPMEFVVHILESFFVLSREKATQIMLSIHTTGSGVAGIFPRDIAETKSEQVNQYAQENNHPLMSTVEMTD